jgi:hypothetical protein
MTEVLSTSNPIPPTGGTNATAPLGISASMSISKSPELTKVLYPQIYSYPRPILITKFPISSSQTVGTNVYTWSTVSTGLKAPLVTDPSFMPWNLIMPYFSRMTKMEYGLYLKPYKVTDAEVKLHILWSYNDSSFNYNTNSTTNHDEEFSFDDASDVKAISVPQFFVHRNITTDKNYTNSTVGVPGAYVPRTKMNLFVANSYQPGLVQPDSFNTQVFVLPYSNSSQVVAGRRYVTGGLTTRVRLTPEPYFLT